MLTLTAKFIFSQGKKSIVFQKIIVFFKLIYEYDQNNNSLCQYRNADYWAVDDFVREETPISKFIKVIDKGYTSLIVHEVKYLQSTHNLVVSSFFSFQQIGNTFIIYILGCARVTDLSALQHQRKYCASQICQRSECETQQTSLRILAKLVVEIHQNARNFI